MFRTLAVAKIDRNPDQPRKAFEQDALDELAASIKANGLIEPLAVRPHPEDKTRFMLIAGERRWRACQAAGIETVACMVHEVDEATAFELSIAENVNRHDMTPLEEAAAYETLQGYDRTVDQVAELFGKTNRYVMLRLQLLGLIPEARGHLDRGEIAVSVAQQMCQLNPTNQTALLKKVIRGDFPNDNAAVHFAYAMRQAEDQPVMFGIEEPTEEQREQRTTAKRKVLTLLDKAEALSEVLGDLAATTIEDYAATGADLRTQIARLDRMHRQITAARFNARQGVAVVEARGTVTIAKEATA